MFNAPQKEKGNFMVVDLAEGVLVGSLMPKDNLPALRSGFAGYPANPRWNIIKYRAWKMGRQLRHSLDEGDLVVRSTDLMLIPATEKSSTLTGQGKKQPCDRTLATPMVLA
jgi:hypothetical protein